MRVHFLKLAVESFVHQSVLTFYFFCCFHKYNFFRIQLIVQFKDFIVVGFFVVYATFEISNPF